MAIGRFLGVLTMLALVAACSTESAPSSSAPVSLPVPSGPSEALSTGIPTPQPTRTTTPSGPVLPAAELPIRGEAHGIPLAPASDGSGYAAISDAGDGGGVTLVRFDSLGRPFPGWPVRVPDATSCRLVDLANDGTLRVICDATDIDQPEWCCDTVRAWAIETDGRVMPGWPVEIDTTAAARVVGNDLVVVSDLPVTDMEAIGVVTKKAHVARIAPDGSVTRGVDVPIIYRGGWETWQIGPDGVAYGVSGVFEGDWQPDRLLAIGLDGMIDGWPRVLEGNASPIAFTDAGRLVVLVAMNPYASGQGEPVWVEALDRDPTAAPARSAPLPFQIWPEVDCGFGPIDRSPLSRGGMVVVRDGMSFHALDSSLEPIPGWPYEAPRYLQEWLDPGAGEMDGLDCATYADPVLGPDGTLYIPLMPVSDPDGGELLAVGRDGTVVPGWPVTLRREAAGFRQVTVGPDGTVFAVAAEPEAEGLSQTLLAIAPDSTVRWKLTLVEP